MSFKYLFGITFLEKGLIFQFKVLRQNGEYTNTKTETTHKYKDRYKERNTNTNAKTDDVN